MSTVLDEAARQILATTRIAASDHHVNPGNWVDLQIIPGYIPSIPGLFDINSLFAELELSKVLKDALATLPPFTENQKLSDALTVLTDKAGSLVSGNRNLASALDEFKLSLTGLFPTNFNIRSSLTKLADELKSSPFVTSDPDLKDALDDLKDGLIQLPPIAKSEELGAAIKEKLATLTSNGLMNQLIPTVFFSLKVRVIDFATDKIYTVNENGEIVEERTGQPAQLSPFLFHTAQMGPPQFVSRRTVARRRSFPASVLTTNVADQYTNVASLPEWVRTPRRLWQRTSPDISYSAPLDLSFLLRPDLVNQSASYGSARQSHHYSIQLMLNVIVEGIDPLDANSRKQTQYAQFIDIPIDVAPIQIPSFLLLSSGVNHLKLKFSGGRFSWDDRVSWAKNDSVVVMFTSGDSPAVDYGDVLAKLGTVMHTFDSLRGFLDIASFMLPFGELLSLIGRMLNKVPLVYLYRGSLSDLEGNNLQDSDIKSKVRSFLLFGTAGTAVNFFSDTLWTSDREFSPQPIIADEQLDPNIPVFFKADNWYEYLSDQHPQYYQSNNAFAKPWDVESIRWK